MSVEFKLYYAGVRVTDLDRSLRFYTEILGMRVAHRGTMPHGGKFVQLKSPGSESILELNWYPESSRFYTEFKRGEELDHLAFVVKDVKRAFDWLVDQGIDVAVSPSESEGTEVYIKDPDGVWIELLQGSTRLDLTEQAQRAQDLPFPFITKREKEVYTLEVPVDPS